jgi:SAM-dependent methyltransferase
MRTIRNMTLNIVHRVRALGNPGRVRRKIGRLLTRRLDSYAPFRHLFEERVGLELGGPSRIFGRRGLFPVYPLAARIDNCDFGNQTTWRGHIDSGEGFQYDSARPPGRQFFGEATTLSFAPAASYDFVLSSEVIEHCANPLKALHECKRILRPEGALFLVLPHKEATFDHRRPVTRLEHLVEDLERDTDEHDLTHLPEILELHDLTLDPLAGSRENFRLRSQKNFENRCLHHHVFDTRLAVEVVDRARLKILAAEPAYPDHITILAVRMADEQAIDNTAFRGHQAHYRRSSPFRSDR